ncbi:hypothetical protein K469DRAFT_611096, partial [Zopfia rhizophila CBS 207.26]
MKLSFLLLSLPWLSHASPLQRRATSATSAISPSSTGWICDATKCSGSSCSANVKRDDRPLAKILAERHLDSPKDIDSQSKYFIYDMIQEDKTAQKLDWETVQVDAVSIDGKFGSKDERAYVAGLTGCTGIIIVSEKGFWMTHLMEPGFMGGGAVNEERWQQRILDVLQQDNAPLGSRFKRPSNLAGPGGILNAAAKVRIFVSTPEGNGQLLYKERVDKVVELLGNVFSGVEVTKRGYKKPDNDKEFEEFEKLSNGKMMVEYSPDQLDEMYESRNPKKAIWRVWLEDEMYEHTW